MLPVLEEEPFKDLQQQESKQDINLEEDKANKVNNRGGKNAKKIAFTSIKQ